MYHRRMDTISKPSIINDRITNTFYHDNVLVLGRVKLYTIWTETSIDFLDHVRRDSKHSFNYANTIDVISLKKLKYTTVLRRDAPTCFFMDFATFSEYACQRKRTLSILEKLHQEASEDGHDAQEIQQRIQFKVARIADLESKMGSYSEMDLARAEEFPYLKDYCIRHRIRFSLSLIDEFLDFKASKELTRYQKFDQFVDEKLDQIATLPILIRTLSGEVLDHEFQYHPQRTMLDLVSQLHYYDPESYPYHSTFVMRIQEGPVEAGELFSAMVIPLDFKITNVFTKYSHITFQTNGTHVSFNLDGTIKKMDAKIYGPSASNELFISYCRSRLSLYL